jgi:ribosomal protein L37AE/L43A
MMFTIVLIFSLLVVGVFLVAYGSAAKNRWGINLDQVSCPHCNRLFPIVRKPNSLRQILWGGWTCSGCGTEIDKWGRELASRVGVQQEGSMRR